MERLQLVAQMVIKKRLVIVNLLLQEVIHQVQYMIHINVQEQKTVQQQRHAQQ